LFIPATHRELFLYLNIDMTTQSEKATGAEPALLTNALICATVATKNLRRAKRFYEETLGLRAAIADERRGVYFLAGSGTMLNLYEREHSTPESSVATFLVENLDDVMSDLRNRGISFEEYDISDLKTKGGVYSDETGFKVAWFKDPDGNIIGIEQLPSESMNSVRPTIGSTSTGRKRPAG
jgi:catechol 2,3-dioxygenase-like lactoylglutathione lyase family enzyme